MIASADKPLEALSVGFIFLPTYRHWHGVDCWWIAVMVSNEAFVPPLTVSDVAHHTSAIRPVE